jgi:hypothetical protein
MVRGYASRSFFVVYRRRANLQLNTTKEVTSWVLFPSEKSPKPAVTSGAHTMR